MPCFVRRRCGEGHPSENGRAPQQSRRNARDQNHHASPAAAPAPAAPRRADLPQDPPTLSPNQWFYAGLHSLSPLRSALPPPRQAMPASRPPVGQPRAISRPRSSASPNRSAAGSSPRSSQAGGQPAATWPRVTDRRLQL